MKTLKVFVIVMLSLLFFTSVGFAAKGGSPDKPTDDGEEAGGNNLSYPVIWAEGVSIPLAGSAPATVDKLNGEWWYWWGLEGEDPNIVPLSCAPDPDNESYCDDGIPLQESGLEPGTDWVKAYLQKDPENLWQAGNNSWMDFLGVDWIDWTDALESVDWYTRSMVRVEVVLYKDLDSPMAEYQMRHVSGWGIDEVHGLAVDQSADVILGDGTRATVYSSCGRLTIQKLLVPRDDPAVGAEPGSPNPVLEGLDWVAANHQWENPLDQDLINEPILNQAVYEGGDGPGYYAAEINVKGKIIYGYTWNVRKLYDSTDGVLDGHGDYRLTFSLDTSCGTDESGSSVLLNTYFNGIDTDTGDYITQIFLPVEDASAPEVESGDETNNETGGGVAVIGYMDNLTYMDVRILEKTGSKKK